MHDVRVLDMLASQGLFEAGAFYVMDRAYLDFARLYLLHGSGAFFVTRVKDNLQFELVRRKGVNTLTGLVSVSHIRLTGEVSCQRYPDVLRRVVYIDEDSGTTENAVKTQIWIAISTYVLIAIVKKKLPLNYSLHEMLRVLNLSLFETNPIPHLLAPMTKQSNPANSAFQGFLF